MSKEPYKIHTVPLHIGDLLGGTHHMDATEFGAYVLLLIACYQSADLSIPCDDERLSRMAHCGQKQWRRVKPVIRKKFIEGDLSWSHKRVLQEAQRMTTRASINRNNRLGNKDSVSPIVKGKPDKTPVSSNQEPESLIQEDTSVSSNNLHVTEMAMFFEQVWDAYPGRGKNGARGAGFKGSKKKAFEKFIVLIKKEKDYEQFAKSVIAGCYLYTAHLDRESWCPSKHLVTWLNQDCWLDDYSTDPGGGGGSHGDALAEGMRGALHDLGRKG